MRGILSLDSAILVVVEYQSTDCIGKRKPRCRFVGHAPGPEKRLGAQLGFETRAAEVYTAFIE
jgi:hypothetical protein